MKWYTGFPIWSIIIGILFQSLILMIGASSLPEPAMLSIGFLVTMMAIIFTVNFSDAFLTEASDSLISKWFKKNERRGGKEILVI